MIQVEVNMIDSNETIMYENGRDKLFKKVDAE
nr:MAG TPA: hypothetical protein [Bacteriophage sp.]